MSKTAVEDVFRISMAFLRKHKYLSPGTRVGEVIWTRTGMWGERKSTVGIRVVIEEDEKYIRINYTQTDRASGDKKDFDYKVPITTTPCNYGGVRYWFRCTLSRNGNHCGRRVGTLYKDGDWFGCRHCWNLTYEARNKNRRNKLQPLFWAFEASEKAQKMMANTKRKTYRGRPTKKQQKISRMISQIGRHNAQFGELEDYL